MLWALKLNFEEKFQFFQRNSPPWTNFCQLGLIFAPYQPADEPIPIFARQLCRTLELKHTRTSSLRGIPTVVFTEGFDYIGDGNETRCFCRKPDKCPKMGTIDIMPCVQAPITVSLPHFLHGDPSLLAMVASGLQPDEAKHGFFLNTELVSWIISGSSS